MSRSCQDRYTTPDVQRAKTLVKVLGCAIIVFLYALGGLGLYLRANYLRDARGSAPALSPAVVAATPTPTIAATPTMAPTPTETLYPTITPSGRANSG